ncbi:MAG: hypothetical protein ABFD54_14985 [Armatimonadota bacterium]|nr:hypothetical protein [bacterium]
MGENGQESLPITGPVEEIVSQRAFAKLVGVEQPSICEAIASGRLSAACVAKTRQGKQLYKERALLEWRQSHPEDVATDSPVQDAIAEDQSLEGSADSADLNTVEWAKLKTKREAIVAGEKAKLLYLDVQEQLGRLLRVEDVDAAWSEIIMSARSKLLALPADISGVLGIKLKRDRVLVQQVIEREVEKVLLELAGDVHGKIGEHRKRRVAKKT